MYGIHLFVLPLFFCNYVSDIEIEQLGRRFCVKRCNREEVVKCTREFLSGVTSAYGECVATKYQSVTTLEDYHDFYCNKADNEEFSFVTKCVVRELSALYGRGYIARVAAGCLRRSGC